MTNDGYYSTRASAARVVVALALGEPVADEDARMCATAVLAAEAADDTRALARDGDER